MRLWRKPDWMSVSSSGLITSTPSNDDVGSHNVTVQVRDSAGTTDQKTFSLTVNNTNDPPEFDPTDLIKSIDQGEAYSYLWSASDDDYYDSFNYEGLTLPDWLTLSSDGLLTGTPSNSDVGSHEIYITVTDSGCLRLLAGTQSWSTT